VDLLAPLHVVPNMGHYSRNICTKLQHASTETKSHILNHQVALPTCKNTNYFTLVTHNKIIFTSYT